MLKQLFFFNLNWKQSFQTFNNDLIENSKIYKKYYLEFIKSISIVAWLLKTARLKTIQNFDTSSAMQIKDTEVKQQVGSPVRFYIPYFSLSSYILHITYQISLKVLKKSNFNISVKFWKVKDKLSIITNHVQELLLQGRFYFECLDF